MTFVPHFLGLFLSQPHPRVQEPSPEAIKNSACPTIIFNFGPDWAAGKEKCAFKAIKNVLRGEKRNWHGCPFLTLLPPNTTLFLILASATPLLPWILKCYKNPNKLSFWRQLWTALASHFNYFSSWPSWAFFEVPCAPYHLWVTASSWGLTSPRAPALVLLLISPIPPYSLCFGKYIRWLLL